MSDKNRQTVRTVSTFTFLAAVVALAVVGVLDRGNLFASPAALPASDDPLANHLSIVDPPALVASKAGPSVQPAANAEAVTPLENWIYTDTPPSRNR